MSKRTRPAVPSRPEGLAFSLGVWGKGIGVLKPGSFCGSYGTDESVPLTKKRFLSTL
jgi:hypothetical protein